MPTFEQFDPTSLQGQISALQGRQQFDPTGYNWGNVFNQYQQEMPTFTPFDPTGLQQRIGALENIEMPSFTQFDPTGLQQRIGALESTRGPSMADIEALINQRFASQSPADNPYAPVVI